MKIRIANENNKLFLASWGQEVEITQGEYETILSGFYTIQENGESYKIIPRELTIQEKKEKLQEQITQINADFDAKISEYLAKYPKREQDTFSEKKREAEKVLAGEESLYISEKAKVLGVSEEQFAQVIIAKNNEWTAKYVALENEKDIQIAQIEQQLNKLLG